MSILGQRNTVTTAATPLWNDPPGASAGARKSVKVQNASAVIVYIGGANNKPLRTLPAVTSVAATDIFTSTGHALAVDDEIIFTALTGGAGLVVNQVYLVATVPDANTFTIKTKAGAAVDHTTNITVATTTAGNFGWALPATSGVVDVEVDRGDMLYGSVASGVALLNVLVSDI